CADGGPKHDIAEVVHVVMQARRGHIRRDRERRKRQSIAKMTFEDGGESKRSGRVAGGKTVRSAIGARATHREFQRLHDRFFLQFGPKQVESEMRPFVRLRLVFGWSPQVATAQI